MRMVGLYEQRSLVGMYQDIKAEIREARLRGFKGGNVIRVMK